MRFPAIPAFLAVLAIAPAALAQDALPGPKTFTRKKDRKPQPKMPPVDINHASREELKRLPGLTEAQVDRIVAGRPWRTKVRLMNEGILSAGLYEQLKARLVAKP